MVSCYLILLLDRCLYRKNTGYTYILYIYSKEPPRVSHLKGVVDWAHVDPSTLVTLVAESRTVAQGGQGCIRLHLSSVLTVSRPLLPGWFCLGLTPGNTSERFGRWKGSGHDQAEKAGLGFQGCGVPCRLSRKCWPLLVVRAVAQVLASSLDPPLSSYSGVRAQVWVAGVGESGVLQVQLVQAEPQRQWDTVFCSIMCLPSSPC